MVERRFVCDDSPNGFHDAVSWTCMHCERRVDPYAYQEGRDPHLGLPELIIHEEPW